VVDDGCTDCTAQVAQELGVHHIVHLKQNRGLASAFSAGMDAALQAGVGIIVNTDADNQYCGEDIAKLIQPILEGQADIVGGDRGVAAAKYFRRSSDCCSNWGVGWWGTQRASPSPTLSAASGPSHRVSLFKTS
jgi:glycosyltransferase involved in cell wall biosynthesis